MILWLTLALLACALLGVPLFVIFGAAAMALFGSLEEKGSIVWAASDVFTEKFADSPMMVTIPLFIFAGYVLAESKAPQRLVELSRAWIGWMPGGLAIVCVLASAFFTTFTGGSGITIVAIGGLLLPALLADNYPEKFSLGLVTTGGSLGLLFPPSLPLILYGIVGGLLIEKLFLAGVLPGLLTLLALGLLAVVKGVRLSMPRTPFRLSHAIAVTWKAKWEVLLPVVLIGGLFSGWLRIHEAAAFAAMYSLVVEVWVYRDLSLRGDLPRIVRESTTMFGAILVILATAIGFTGYLIQAQVPMRILESMSGVFANKWVFLLLMNGFLLVVGMLMDIFSAIVVVAPLLVPIATHPDIGVDPYHLGIVFLLNLEIGYLTPPVGLNLFISSFRFEKPITLLYRAVLPFIGVLLVALLLTTYIPWLSTGLAGLVTTEELPDLRRAPVPSEPSDTHEEVSNGAPDEMEGDAFNLDDLERELLGAFDDLDQGPSDAGVGGAASDAAGWDVGAVR